MANKYEFITELAEITARRIASSREEWTRYLKTAARLYRYPFREQMLIYAQKPDATAVASMKIWNERMNCWINRGAKGIALIDEARPHMLKYVFDVSSVHKSRIGKYPKPWELRDEHREEVMNFLEYTYGKSDSVLSFEEQLIEIAGKIAGENTKDLLPVLKNVQEDSFLEGLDDLNLELRLRETLSSSIAYTLLFRCGMDADAYIDVLNFDFITDFSSFTTLNVLGDATSSMCEPVLREICRVVNSIDLKMMKENQMEQGNASPAMQKNVYQKGLANAPEKEYNALKRESDEGENINREGGREHGNNIQTGRELSDTESDDAGRTGGNTDEVRNAETDISEGTLSGDLLGDVPVGQADRALPDDSGPGRGQGRPNDKPDDEVRGSNRGAEGTEPDGMGTEDELNSQPGGRGSAFGNSIQSVTGNIATAENGRKIPDSADFFLSGEQMQEVVAGEEKLPEKGRMEAHNFQITDDAIGTGSEKEKFRANIAAIQMLKKCEEEGRLATEEEQTVMARYVGWGGLSNAFDETKSSWGREYLELKSVLTEEEYISARESTLNAHYTSPEIIRGIYDTLGRMGFEKGNVLEPAMGIGNFFGMLPETMQESRLYGVELDSISGRIAKQLYPKSDIRITGYEDAALPNDFFDVAVGNVPFGQYKINDREYNKHNFLVHDYFFAKTLDKVRSGGVVAFITSKGTMDKQNESVRRYLAERADFLGGVRLPNTAFRENAGTEVTSDILIFQKRDRLVYDEPEWIHTARDEKGIEMNAYFARHPEQIVGHMEMVSGPFGMESACIPDTDRPFDQQLREALSHIEGSIDMVTPAVDELGTEAEDRTLPASPEIKNFSYAVIENQVYYRENSIMKPVDVPETKADRIKGMVAIRDSVRELINIQMEEAALEEIAAQQKKLNDLYDSFEKRYGRINSRTNKSVFNQDSSYALLCSLEKFDSDGNFKAKADMFTKRTIKRAEVVTSVDTASEALAVSLSEKAKVDLPYMAELSNKTEQEITNDLAGVIFKEPLTEQWKTADDYLSGNVREKLAVAEKMAESDTAYAINVEALKRVMPPDLDASEIEVRIGATWIAPEYYDQFMKEILHTPDYLTRTDNYSQPAVCVQYSDVTGQWNVKGKNADRNNPLANAAYGTQRVNAYKILEDSLNLKDCRVFDITLEDGKEKRILNKK